jgi:tetratricopeptide (TPR) repeat protein
VARAFWRWSDVRVFGGHNAQQVTLIERARNCVTALGGTGEDYGRLMESLGKLYLRTNRLADAEAAYQLALAAFTAIDERLGEANTRTSLGDLYLRTNRLADAETAYRLALAAFIAIDDRLGEANTISALGRLAVARGCLAEGFEQFRSARAMLLAIDERLSAAGQLAYMARAARLALFIDRAIVLGGMAWREFRAVDARFNVMLGRE